MSERRPAILALGFVLAGEIQVETLPRGTFTTVNVVDRTTLAPILSDISNDKSYHLRLEFVDPNYVKAEQAGAPRPSPVTRRRRRTSSSRCRSSR